MGRCGGAAGNDFGSEVLELGLPESGGLWKVGEGARPSGCLSPEGDSGCRPGHAFVLLTVSSWAMTYYRQSPLGGRGGGVVSQPQAKSRAELRAGPSIPDIWGDS